MNTKVNATYSTKDLNLASYLWALQGVDLISETPKASGGNTREIFFEFSFEGRTDKDVQGITREYFNGKSVIDPLKFAASQSRLRHLIHEQRSAG